MRISCLLTGYPCRSIKWYINGEQLLPTKDGRIYFESKSELVIRKLRQEDCGSLLLQATNKYGEAFSSISLKPNDELSSPKNRIRSKTFSSDIHHAAHKNGPLKRRITGLFGKISHR